MERYQRKLLSHLHKYCIARYLVALTHPRRFLWIISPEAGAKPNLSKVELEKKEKATIENGPSLAREGKKGGKSQDNKPADKNGEEKLILTSAEFEESVQTVACKSLRSSWP